MCDTGDDAEVAAGGAAAAVDAGATLQNLLQQGAAGSAGLDPNLAAQLVTALKDQVQRATSTLTAQVATLEATSLRDREASDHKRRRTEALRVVEERKWETSRANGAVREATKTQFDSGFVLKELQSISTLLAPPPSGSAPDQGDQAAARSLVLLADLTQSDIAEIFRVVTESAAELEVQVASAMATIATFLAAEPWGSRGSAVLVQHMDCLAPEHKRVDCPEFKAALALATSAAKQAASDHGISKAVGGGGGSRGGGGSSHGQGRGRNRGRGTGGRGGRGGRGGKGGSASNGKERAADEGASDSADEVSYD